MKNLIYDSSGENIFSPKELYLMSCTSSGKSIEMMGLPESQRKKLELNNMHLIKGMEMSDKNGFPILQPFNGGIDFDFIPYSKRGGYTPQEYGIHFFEDDYKFNYAMWDVLEQSIYRLRDYKAVMCPDHSLFIEEDDYSFLNKWSVYRSRFAGAVGQLRGYNMIPTASWGGADSFDYCFESLPHNSVIAVCGVGIDSCRLSRELWEYGVRELADRITPTLIIIYGIERKVPGLSIPTRFIPPYISTIMKGRKEVRNNRG